MVATKYGKVITAHLGQATGLVLSNGQEFVVVGKDAAALKGFFDAIGLPKPCDLSKTVAVAVVRQDETDLDVARHQPTPRENVPVSYAAPPPPPSDDEDW